MLLSFTLSMPSRSSWNGKWSGDGKTYVVVRNFSKSKEADEKAKEILRRGYFSYGFGDGWTAAITVEEVDAKTAARLRRQTAGFCNYDWMVDSICNTGDIKLSTK